VGGRFKDKKGRKEEEREAQGGKEGSEEGKGDTAALLLLIIFDGHGGRASCPISVLAGSLKQIISWRGRPIA
jgi:serine/threonine protein phosphatase PrpC